MGIDTYNDDYLLDDQVNLDINDGSLVSNLSIDTSSFQNSVYTISPGGYPSTSLQISDGTSSVTYDKYIELEKENKSLRGLFELLEHMAKDEKNEQLDNILTVARSMLTLEE